jgi:hypothetical protein
LTADEAVAYFLYSMYTAERLRTLRRELWHVLRAPLFLLAVACGVLLVQLVFEQLGPWGEPQGLFSLLYLVVFKAAAALGVGVIATVVPAGIVFDDVTRRAFSLRRLAMPVRLRSTLCAPVRTRSLAGPDRPPRRPC